ncbi:sodium channel modifier 1 [Gadus chalcogrammus]|uniref:sodium channel modifier 1 n=1 Tax=Gadus chalcogrammus TaxID=1042646 RepID=UPI0024C4B7A1|nr:sodium channel modifier 1 [Gadus chalcogrammus]
MSFKREGNDPSQLNVLKKRRVADLLAHFIPEDEADLMRNGRYTCLVCTSRPIFDTIDMLTVHRKGKRHLDGMKWYYGKKSQLKREITKRQHSNYVQEEEDRQNERQEPSSSAPLLVQTRKITHHALLKTVPYNSRHKKLSTEKGIGSDPADPLAPSGSAPLEVCERTIGSKEAPAASSPSSYPAGKVSNSKPLRGKKEHKAIASEPVTAERRRELEHYLQMKSDGWLQDRSGQWVKDENVEFDSDSDEPPPSAPPPPGDEED